MKLSLGPLLYYWPRDRTIEFYREAESMPVDVVYLGETVCARRHELRPADWLEIARRLAASGKEAVLSSLTLIESESDLKGLRRLAQTEEFAIEANEMGMVRMLADLRPARPFVAGPSLNVYNSRTLALLHRAGARRWVIPHEMSREALEPIQSERPAGMQTEALAYGRIPLAWSARCFTARRFNLQKDGCEFRCLDYPDGIEARTVDGRDFVVLNGVQTQSARVYDLANDLPALRVAGVDVIRISPQSEGTAEVVSLFRGAIDGAIAPHDAGARVRARMPGQPCDGFWHGRAGMDEQAG